MTNSNFRFSQKVSAKNRMDGLLLSTALVGSLLFLASGGSARAEVDCVVNVQQVPCVEFNSIGYDAVGTYAEGVPIVGGDTNLINGATATTTVSGDNSTGTIAGANGGVGANGEDVSSLVDNAGKGAPGGNGGNATITVEQGATVTIGAAGVSGALARADGGAGGVGGNGSDGADGGTGGDGGNAGTATAINQGTLTVTGGSAAGLTASAVGGAGALPGTSGYWTLDQGGGGAGGNGGTATVTNAAGGSVATTGQNSAGISALVDGGSGANIAEAGIDNSDYVNASASGNGGNAGNATATNDGTITTQGDYSAGIFAQAVGGDAGTSPADNGATRSETSGNGGTISVTNSGTVNTSGLLSDGIVAITNSGAITLVTTSSSNIATTGANSSGIYLDSDGSASDYASQLDGGQILTVLDGGNVNATIAGTIKTTGASTYEDESFLFSDRDSQATPYTSSGVKVNTSGGTNTDGSQISTQNGGNAGIVTMTVEEGTTISTAGSLSDGIGIVAIGGSGVDNTYSTAHETGGDGGRAGAVSLTIKENSSITTTGVSANGVYVYSAGGDGGTGENTDVEDGGNGGQGGTAAVTLSDLPYAISVLNSGKISTSGTTASAINVESVGGSGGDGGSTDNRFADKGAAGASGAGGSIQVINAGELSTSGDQSYGIYALTVGGGGAAAGSAGSSDVFAFVVGGDASGGGSGGDLNLSNTGTITTTGDSGIGIYGLSVGGGGGNAGTVDATALGFGFPSISVAVGGNGGLGGDGGTVTIDNSASIATSGFDAVGIQAMSVGGGGGNGGGASASSYAAGFKLIPALTVSIGVGGTGGNGGDGGAVVVTNEGDLTTTGDQAYGVLAMSAGGGGGHGGNAATQTYSYGAAKVGINVGVALGGSGGDGGAGGSVNVTNSQSIATSGFGADAIYAMSVGGGGGAGGVGRSLTSTSLPASGLVGDLPVSFNNTYSLNLGIGGSGGQGNDGGILTITNVDAITTTGTDARGILAQSIGGGGGSAAAGQASGASTVTLNVGVGGSGGAGGNGSTVTVNNETGSSITTSADGAHGIQAQSIGGGGGSGGTASADRTGSELASAAKYAAKNTTMQYLYGFLSLIGQGETADMVKPTWQPSVSLNVGVGGSGGAAGDGGEVHITNDGAISTGGDIAFALFGQSVGGGGGTGSSASVAGGAVLNYSSGAGGSNGANGNGGELVLTNNESITTTGDSSFGMLGQSIGGGGGVTGSALDVSTISAAPFVSLGANRAGDIDFKSDPVTGSGGEVQLINTGTITTSGSEAHGMVAQSIGGGGGVAFINQSETDISVAAEQDADIQALYQQIEEELAATGDPSVQLDSLASAYQQALNSASGSIWLELGGLNTLRADGGEVIASNSGAITTTGNNAFGIVAQSIGGGGGLVTDGDGTSLSLSLNNGSDNDYEYDSEGNLVDKGLPISAPIFGGGNGDGGEVTVNLASGSSISTSGAGAVGVFAQSIGGGGGYTGALDVSDMAFSTAVPDAGLYYSYDTTTGALSYPILFYSFAGAGGLVTVTGGDDSDAGMSITTTGQNAHGVFAQSISYGGGVVADENGIVIPETIPVPADNADWIGLDCQTDNTCTYGVTIDLTGTIDTSGDGSVGIYAQSGIQTSSSDIDGNGSVTAGLGKIDITYSGILNGGSGTGAGIWIDGGTDNTIQLNTATVSSLSGTAIRSTIGNETVTFDSASVVTGDVILDTNSNGETNTLTNNGTFNPTSLVALGGTGVLGLAGPSSTPSYLNGTFSGYVSQGSLTNNGTINAGGLGTVSNVEIYGDFEQTVSGTISVDVDPGTIVQSPVPNADASINWVAADYLKVEGSAQIGGSVTPSLAGRPQAANDGTFSAAFLGAGAISAQTPDGEIVPVISTPVVTYTLAQQQADTPIYTLAGSADFSAAASSAANNLQEIAAQLQEDWLSGQADSEDPNYTDMLVSVANEPDTASYETALSNLEGGGHAVQAAATVNRSKSYSDTLYSCPVFVGSSALLSEESCTYSRMIFDSFDYSDEGNQTTGYDQSGYTMLFGGQKALENNWYLGGSFALGHAELDGDDGRISGDEDTYQVGVVAKKRIGPSWMIGASAYYGYSDGDMTRNVMMADGSMQSAVSSPDTHTFGARVRASYDIDLGQSYLRPLMDFDAIFTHTPGYSEHGAAGLNLAFSDTNDWTFGVTPGLEIGARLPFEGGIARPFATAAVTQWFENDLTMATRIDGSAGSGFNTTYELGDTVGRISAGVEFVLDSGLELRGQYDGAFAKDSSSNSGTIRLGWRF